jgi:hypothetical protein
MSKIRVNKISDRLGNNETQVSDIIRKAGYFANGFTFKSPNEIGVDANNQWWSYSGSLPFTVPAGTVPSEPTYTQRGNEALRSALADPDSTVLVGGVEAGMVGKKISLSGFKDAKEFFSDALTVGYSGKKYTVGEGEQISVAGYNYLVMAESALNYHAQTASGLRLNLIPKNGSYNLEALGVDLDGSIEITVYLARLLSSGANKITAPDNSVLLLNNLAVTSELLLRGNFTVTKPTVNSTMITISTGQYKVKFHGVDFDGKYSGGGVAGGDDILVSDSGNNGLEIEFVECKHNNISNRFLHTGYPQSGRIKSVKSKRCCGNGNHIYRAANDERAIYSVHYTKFDLDDYEETGDGVFALSGDVITRMPILQVFSTSCKFKAKNPQITDGGGILLYRDCDNASIINPDIDNTGYPLRVQQSKNTRVFGGAITNCPFQFGAIHWAPYARIGTALQRAVAGLSGLFVQGTVFSGNHTDLAAQGVHSQSGGSHGVADCRASGINIKANFMGATVRNFDMQDADFNAAGSVINLSATQTEILRHIQTAANGAGFADLSGAVIDGSLRTAASANCVILNNPNITTGVQNGTGFVMRHARLKNMRCVAAPMIYLRGAGTVDVSDNTWTGTLPEYMALLRDHLSAKVWSNLGFNYPLTTSNGRVNVGGGFPESIAQLVYDGDKQVNAGTSLVFSSSAPSATHYTNGSLALMPNSDGANYTARVLTGAGWKRTWLTD